MIHPRLPTVGARDVSAWINEQQARASFTLAPANPVSRPERGIVAGIPNFTRYASAISGTAVTHRLRLPRARPPRPPAAGAGGGPVVAIIPAYNEEPAVGAVVAGIPRTVHGRAVRVLVIDDGSTDGTAPAASLAGAVVVSQPANLGLGAAVRRGLAEAVALDPACVVYLDADGEYDPAELGRLAAPILAGVADYVVGSRFAGGLPRGMRRHRMLGNLLLTRWVRWMAREPGLTDGQSGYRAFAPAAAASARIGHDYNYAQVLTLNLLGKGFRYAEVPISYAFRTTGTSYIRLGRYLRRVLPAVYRELNGGSVLDHVAGEPLPRGGPGDRVAAAAGS
jgi:glycosyltransferase involved in cell wall biosynthesis